METFPDPFEWIECIRQFVSQHSGISLDFDTVYFDVPPHVKDKLSWDCHRKSGLFPPQGMDAARIRSGCSDYMNFNEIDFTPEWCPETYLHIFDVILEPSSSGLPVLIKSDRVFSVVLCH